MDCWLSCLIQALEAEGWQPYSRLHKFRVLCEGCASCCCRGIPALASEDGDGQSYAHCRGIRLDPQNMKQNHGARLHPCTSTMLCLINAANLRSDDGLGAELLLLVAHRLNAMRSFPVAAASLPRPLLNCTAYTTRYPSTCHVARKAFTSASSSRFCLACCAPTAPDCNSLHHST